MVKQIAGLILSLVLLVGLGSCRVQEVAPSGGDIVIGSKAFTEQGILGEILAQHIEANTNLKVTRRLWLQGTFICHNALKSGEIDGYVEYTGTAFAAILQKTPISDATAVYQQVKQAYGVQFSLEVMSPLGFENTYAMIIRGKDARKYNLTTISQLVDFQDNWRPGFGYEFFDRADGFPGLVAKYGLKFAKTPKVMDLGLMYRALVFNQVDLVAGNSTDGLIQKLDLFQLQDDKHYFPPYEAVPIFRQATLAKYPQLRGVIEKLGGIITAPEMQAMNYQVDGEFRPIEAVAREFLLAKGLIKP